MYEIQMHPFIAFPIFVSLSLLFWSTYKYVHKSSQNKKSPPSPPKLPILGNLHQLGSLTHQDFHVMARKYGPLMLLHFGSMPVLIASSADTACEILKIQDLTFCSRPEMKVLKKLLYGCRDVAFSPYGEYWRQMKSIFVLWLLSGKRVESFRTIREEETALFLKKVEESAEPVNLSEMFGEFTNDVISRSAFGARIRESGKGKKLVWLLGELVALLGLISVGDFIPWLGWIDRVTGLDKRLDRAAKEFDDFLYDVIQERIDVIKDEPDIYGENFVDILLKINKEGKGGETIAREGIKALLFDVLAGGTDTISTTLEWTMTELLRHPTVLEKLQNEIRDIVKGKRHITDDDITKMHYLKAVIKETLRYHPPLPLLVSRVSMKDATINGYHISAGTLTMINVWTIGRDVASWDDAEEFRPERFLNSSMNFKGADFKFIPFGAGRRGCPGIAYAEATMEFMLANIVKSFDWKLAKGAQGQELDVTEAAGITAHRATPLFAVGVNCA